MTSDGWHTEPPDDNRLVLCQGKLGGFFIGSYHKVEPEGFCSWGVPTEEER